MRRPTIAAVIAFVSQLLLVAAVSAQAPNYDLAFEARIRDVSLQVTRLEGAEAAELRRAFAAEAFSYFQQNPETTSGTNALGAAFSMWAGIAAVDEVEYALSFVGADSPLWIRILPDIRSTYRAGGRSDAYEDLLVRLEQDATDPGARAAVLLARGEVLLGRQQTDEALTLFHAVASLASESAFAVQARGHIHEIENLAPGQAAPEFEATTLDGSRFRLSGLRGQFVLLEFWATWCAPCIPEIPYLKRLDEQYRDAGLAIVGISFDSNLAALQQLVESEGIAWTQIQQRDGFLSESAQLFHVDHVPRSILLDREGRIVAKDLRKEGLESFIAGLPTGAAEP